jgi:hypothetical protein
MYNFSVADAHTYFVGNDQWLVHNECKLFRKEHASLGLNDELQLFEFSVNTKSHYYGMWHKGGLLDHPASAANFADFKTAMDRAKHIHFNLDGIRGDLEAFRQLGSGGKFDGSAPWTAVELFSVTTNPDWHAKTKFYLNGEELKTSPFK